MRRISMRSVNSTAQAAKGVERARHWHEVALNRFNWAVEPHMIDTACYMLSAAEFQLLVAERRAYGKDKQPDARLA